MTQHEMSAGEMADRVRAACPGTVDLQAGGDHYVIYDPDGDLPPALQHPFVTVVTSDAHDQASDLDRPGVWRLNIGLPRVTYEQLFGRPRDADQRYDLTELGRLMPHPVYGGQYWVCVLNPGPDLLGTVDALVQQAYELAVRKHTNRTARRST